MSTEKKADHTPGPWRAWLPADKYSIIVYDSNSIPMATISLGKEFDWIGENLYANGVAEANARLIAAAPNMLAALKTAKQWFAEWGVEIGPAEESLLETLEAAIQKAEAAQ